MVVGRAGCCCGGQSSAKLESTFSADEWGWVPSLLVFWPGATQHWSLPGSLVGLMADSGRAHAKEYFPELLLPVSLSSR